MTPSVKPLFDVIIVIVMCRQEVEPTVTISTKAAFEALNSMFSGSLPHEQQGQREAREALHATGQLPPRPQRPRSKGLAASQPPAHADTASLPAAHRGTELDTNPGSPSPFGVYEDTGLLVVNAEAQGISARSSNHDQAVKEGLMPGHGLATGVEETGGLLVYEDTGLLQGRGQQSPGFVEEASGNADETQGFVLYEDTALLQPAASPAGEDDM